MFSVLAKLRRLTSKKRWMKWRRKSKKVEGNWKDCGRKNIKDNLTSEEQSQPSNSQTSLKDLIALAQKEMFLEQQVDDTYLEIDKDSCYNGGSESDEDIYEEMVFSNLSCNSNDLYMTMVFKPPEGVYE